MKIFKKKIITAVFEKKEVKNIST